MGEDRSTIDTVQVALRIRPLMQSELERACDECIEVVQGQPQVVIKDLSFTYNYVFAQHITQQEFYDTAVKGLIGRLFQGYNVTILAYGQTGSGKTYTMGTNYSGSDGDSTKLGVIPQAVADIFDYIETHEDKYIFRVNVSFMELYQEQCYDLLSGKERGHSIIEIREDINKGVILPGITEVPVTSTMETMMILERGSMGRVTGSTAMNQASSRSHAVFTIVIAKESRTDKNIATTSKFHLVDLAGSERIKKTKASGERLKEGVKINQGLLALGNVISALGDGTNRSFISYRDSKLTRLLQDSLGGNSLTLMVACVSPADYNLDETVSTLRYADRARRIRNKPVINQDAKAAEIVRLNNLVNELRLQLLGKSPSTSEQNNEQLQESLEKERARYAELLKKHKQVTEHLSNMLIENTNLCEKALLAEAAKEKMERKLNELTEQCNQTIENLNTSDKDGDPQKTMMEYLKDMKTRLEDLQSMNLRTNEEMIDHEIKVSFVSDTDTDKIDSDVVLSEEQAVVEEEKRAIGHVALTQELRELNHAMAIKASVVQAILANNKEMLESHGNLRENEERISKLERERDELLQQLKQTKSKDPTHEERRTKVSSLEAEIQELKKKCQQQANTIKMKEKNEAKIAALNAELHAMKATKVNLHRYIHTGLFFMSSLEAEIQELKQKCQQQANTIKMKEKNEAKIAALNAELHAMKATKKRGQDRRAQRYEDHKAEIQELKKKCQQQANTIKMKEKNEAKIAALNAELHAMKATKELKKKCQQQANTIKMKEKNEAKIAALNAELHAMKATKVNLHTYIHTGSNRKDITSRKEVKVLMKLKHFLHGTWVEM
ncbi:kinesin motor domain-containing protein [Phthorimaea operculella]|nr:kinesin motor domain-containing protein [Phthorimaea operculella]